MKYTKYVKGHDTPLTYKVVLTQFFWGTFWGAEIYEPYRKRRFLGLLPESIAYRCIYRTGELHYAIGENPLPDTLKKTAEVALKECERHKLAWESTEVD